MKAPEKIYIDPHPFMDEYEEYWFSSPADDKSIEYVRKDVFIDNICDWLEDHIYEYLKMNKIWNEPDYDPKLIEDFRNYIKKNKV